MKPSFQLTNLITRIVAAAVVVISLKPAVSSALVITPTFTANFNSNFGANAAAAQASWIAAANQFTSNFSDPIHVNITVDGVAGTSILGQSSTFLQSIAYANILTRFGADATTPTDATAVGAGGSLSGADPVGSAHTYWLSTAQAKAIGYIADNLSTDGTTTFGAGFTYTFSGPIAGGAYDFQHVAAHEISEVMGRLGISGGTIGASANSFSVIDLLSYTGSGARGMGNGAGNSFSVDGGITLLKLFNNQSGLGGDSRDWASGSFDAFNAFSNSGVANTLTPVDFQLMDALGYNLIPAPEPATSMLLISGLGMGLCLRRRQK